MESGINTRLHPDLPQKGRPHRTGHAYSKFLLIGELIFIVRIFDHLDLCVRKSSVNRRRDLVGFKYFLQLLLLKF